LSWRRLDFASSKQVAEDAIRVNDAGRAVGVEKVLHRLPISQHLTGATRESHLDHFDGVLEDRLAT